MYSAEIHHVKQPDKQNSNNWKCGLCLETTGR